MSDKVLLITQHLSNLNTCFLVLNVSSYVVVVSHNVGSVTCITCNVPISIYKSKFTIYKPIRWKVWSNCRPFAKFRERDFWVHLYIYNNFWGVQIITDPVRLEKLYGMTL